MDAADGGHDDARSVALRYFQDRQPESQVHWSKPPDIFRSSTMVERGFCAACGTPLTYRRIEGAYVSVTLMSLDHPEHVQPEMVFSAASAPDWCHALADLPRREMDLTPGFIGYQDKDER